MRPLVQLLRPTHRLMPDSRVFQLAAMLIATVAFTSCHSSRSFMYHGTDVRELVRAGNALGFDIELKDNWPLMIEAATWMGTPYRYGGNTRAGVDCSGLNVAVYQAVFNRKLSRNSREQFETDCSKVNKRKLRQGDLVFFAIADKVNTRNINHTGIYLKDGHFIHASTSRGVVVDKLDTPYFSKYWVAGGRVK